MAGNKYLCRGLPSLLAVQTTTARDIDVDFTVDDVLPDPRHHFGFRQCDRRIRSEIEKGRLWWWWCFNVDEDVTDTAAACCPAAKT